MTGPTFEEIAAELYAGPLEAFVSSRKARAAEADASLAPRILALRKPSIAAWVVNVFAQERAVQLGEALTLARELREAQEDLDAVALAKLGRERRALTRKLAQAAGELASSRESASRPRHSTRSSRASPRPSTIRGGRGRRLRAVVACVGAVRDAGRHP